MKRPPLHRVVRKARALVHRLSIEDVLWNPSSSANAARPALVVHSDRSEDPEASVYRRRSFQKYALSPRRVA